MADQERDPPSERGARATGRHKAVSSDDWTTQKRAVDKAERARREDAVKRGALEVRTAQLEHEVGALEKVCDGGTIQLTLHEHRLTKLESDMKAKIDGPVQEAAEFIAGINGVLATLKWAIPVLLTATAGLASGITYLLSHK